MIAASSILSWPHRQMWVQQKKAGELQGLTASTQWVHTAHNTRGSVNHFLLFHSEGCEGLRCRCLSWFWFLGPWEKKLVPSFSPEISQTDTQPSSPYPSLWPFRTDSRWGHGHRSLAHTKMSVWDFNYKSLILHQHSISTHQSTGVSWVC